MLPTRPGQLVMATLVNQWQRPAERRTSGALTCAKASTVGSTSRFGGMSGEGGGGAGAATALAPYEVPTGLPKMESVDARRLSVPVMFRFIETARPSYSRFSSSLTRKARTSPSVQLLPKTRTQGGSRSMAGRDASTASACAMASPLQGSRDALGSAGVARSSGSVTPLLSLWVTSLCALGCPLRPRACKRPTYPLRSASSSNNTSPTPRALVALDARRPKSRP
mmetsp:Transcript_51854/g.118137  ORF Transcript_51854/g.118137 Transcript_51854/m.118137 type:complete len:224 (+) Transcript_51854:1252-1923(+)